MTMPEKLLNQDVFHQALMAAGKDLMVEISVIYLVQAVIFFQLSLVVHANVMAQIYKLRHQLDLKNLSMALS